MGYLQRDYPQDTPGLSCPPPIPEIECCSLKLGLQLIRASPLHRSNTWWSLDHAFHWAQGRNQVDPEDKEEAGFWSMPCALHEVLSAYLQLFHTKFVAEVAHGAEKH